MILGLNGNMSLTLINQIDAILPQTQCTRCGYDCCLDYAIALSEGNANINQCPPGGDTGITKLAKLLNQPIIPLNTKHGEIKNRQVAIIQEDDCIGCTLCIKACPVDAIIGSNKMMHTVITDHCTGCDLCLPACPVDCIIMEDAHPPSWTEDQRNDSQQRYSQHKLRKKLEIEARNDRLKQVTELHKQFINN